MRRILIWCQMMILERSGRVRWGKENQEPVEVISTSPVVKVEESTIFLNRREASFINREVRRLLKAKLAEEERKKKAGIPSPPEPGKITYAVYH